MREDIERMKAAHITAVRNSHYPNDPQWYALCDMLGMYVMDEANLESHGMGSAPRDGSGQTAAVRRSGILLRRERPR